MLAPSFHRSVYFRHGTPILPPARDGRDAAGYAPLWLSLLNPPRADHLVDSLAGPQHECKIVLGAAVLSMAFSFIAAIRGSKWWHLGVTLLLGTLAQSLLGL